MASTHRSNRKASDEDIIRMNAVGLSLNTIAQELGCHPTTISARLHNLGITPADTRRSFMEEVIASLTPDEQRWLADQLGPTTSIKKIVRNLLVDAHKAGSLRTSSDPESKNNVQYSEFTNYTGGFYYPQH